MEIKRLSLLAVLLCGMAWVHAQTSKGLKALEAKDYPTAKAAFEAAIASDPNDAAAHLGMSRYYAVKASGELNLDEAIASLEKAESIYGSGDAKVKAKLEKDGVTALSLKERRDRIEAAILEDVKQKNTIAAYDAFLARFPNSSVARPATTYRDELAFNDAKSAGTEAAWNDFVGRYPKSEMMPQAVTIRNQVAADYALKMNTEEIYSAYVKNYPDAQQTPQMQQRLNAVAFDNAKAKNTAQAYEDYIRLYPESIFIPQAQERLSYIRGGVGDD